LTFEAAFLAGGDAPERGVITELYDSGATRHMSPFRDKFINFEAIIPKPIGA